MEKISKTRQNIKLQDSIQNNDSLISVEFYKMPVANYAIQHNKIPVIQKLVITNTSETDLFDLKISIYCEPEFANNFTHGISILPSEKSIVIPTQSLKLSSKFLASISEGLSGIINIMVEENSGNILFENEYNIDITAYNHWYGLIVEPQLLSSFITPNHPEIAKVLQKAATLLQKWSDDPSFDAYQSRNKNRVKQQMGAIYEAITSQNIIYNAPPASFEDSGQKIRMCDQILTDKLGTCLDTTVLFASCLEAIGINPLIIITKGHAFAGAWLEEDAFSNSVNDDISMLTNRTAKGINQILLVETTAMTMGKKNTFDEAILLGNRNLQHENDFLLFIDVLRSRLEGIRPLPQRLQSIEGNWEVIEDTQETHREVQEPSMIRYANKIVKDVPNVDTDKLTKQQLWERKLLDLSLRNNLLNFRPRRSSLQLMSVNLELFEDALADGAEFQVLTKPENWKPNSIDENPPLLQTINSDDPVSELIAFDLEHKKLRTFLPQAELKSILTKLYRSSRLSLEENGANTLFLALGFLKWYENERSKQSRYAPLLLLPIEIVRKSAQQGFVIRSREEETVFNITLLEMLKQDFDLKINGLAELPRDESGVDVIEIFNLVRRGIMQQKRWDVEEQAFIGTFSFSKFIMWNDIHNNNEHIAKHPIVNSFIDGKAYIKVEDKATTRVDDLHPTEIILPISADSKQLKAIYAAAMGKSFVLHGPPGTGKSQTITNIIANSLYHGKRVLFVAEKMAALSVVQRRLADIGLGPFCLELHSNKAKKSTVLEQLKQTSEVVRKTSPKEFKECADKLHQQKQKINAYVNALHEKQAFGYSLFDIFNNYSEQKEGNDNITFSFDPKSTSESQIEDWIELVEELENTGTMCGHPFGHPLRGINSTEYSPLIKDESLNLIKDYQVLIHKIIGIQAKIKGLLGYSESQSFDIEKIRVFNKLIIKLSELRDLPKSLLVATQLNEKVSEIMYLSEAGIRRDQLKQNLLESFTPEILKLPNANTLLNMWLLSEQSWFLKRLLTQNKISKQLNIYSSFSKIKKIEIKKALQTLIDFQTEEVKLKKGTEFLSKHLDYLWETSTPDWNRIIKCCEEVNRVSHLILNTAENLEQTKAVKAKIGQHYTEGGKMFINNDGKVLLEYNELVVTLNSIENAILDLISADFEINDVTDALQAKMNISERWGSNLDLLRDWTSWNRVKEKAVAMNLTTVIKAYYDGDIKDNKVSASFIKSINKYLAYFIISQNPDLYEFNGKVFETIISKFAEYDDYFQRLTKAELVAMLSSNLPTFADEASNASELGILKRVISSKGRGMSIRTIFDKVPNLLPKMAPCVLMSPISAAQYFDIKQNHFDIVIFDEASQMPTYEAIGAIARGKSLIVVGDPKQMPPTAFFSSNQFDEDNADLEDLESILDDCIALSLPSEHLLWHYRSKHESLIAFSNNNYYDNQLLTFPSPDDLTRKVSYTKVHDAYYDRGKTRTNHKEALAIVEEIKRIYKDKNQQDKSVGVVTFSSTQQNIIEDLLNEEFKKDSILENAALECTEPLFVKNLENVQGDERDIILFSIGYGPDKEGRLYMNFGPLNREGGWRRLNVAVSRARYEMKIFSTLESDMIDLSRNSSDGVSGLKSFLEFAEKGKISQTQQSVTQNLNSNHLKNEIAEQLTKKGYKVNVKIGVSAYKIDLGIIHPKNEHSYILGILLDGYQYYGAESTKDRELTQPNVLKALGWNIYRLYSCDYWDNPQREINRIIKKVELLLDNNEVMAEEELNDDIIESEEVLSISQELVSSVKNSTIYKETQLEQQYQLGAEDFYYYVSSKKEAVIKQINDILSVEAPISHSLLLKKVLKTWGVKSTGSRLNRLMTTILEEMQIKTTFQDSLKFYWNHDQIPDNYNVYRNHSVFKRNVDDIAKEEVSNAALEVVKNQISIPEEDLVRETAKLFSYTRIGNNVYQSMLRGIKYAVSKNTLVLQNGRYIIVKSFN